MKNIENARLVYDKLASWATKRTQEIDILQHMLFTGPITPLEALTEYGCLRLGARIYDLEHKYPIRIKHEMVGNGTKAYMQYSLEEDENA